ncbi:MAG: PadR family transcriptional regulator [candidate division WOR-3 bacterium]
MKIKFIDRCIIIMLASKKIHGYYLYREFKDAGFDISMVNFYKKLKKLENMGLISSEWRIVNGRPRKVYYLTEKGEKKLKACKENLKKFLFKIKGSIPF